MRRLLAGAAGTAAAVALIGAPCASAAVEFGDTCGMSGGLPVDYTITSLSAPEEEIPLAAPSAGVVTKVTVRVADKVPLLSAIPLSIKALRPAGEGLFTTVGEAILTLPAGKGPYAAVANARIPVQAGDRLGLAGLPFVVGDTVYPGYILACASSSEFTLGAAVGSTAIGSISAFSPYMEGRLPVSATLEPDADGDGFGDETQDRCPQSPAAQGPCPPVAVEASSVIRRKGSVVVLVSTDAAAPVTVAGTAALGKGKRAKLSSNAQTVVPGKVGRFTLNFPQKLKKKLAGLKKSRSVQLKVTASATDLIGRVTSDSATVKLKGQAKRKR